MIAILGAGLTGLALGTELRRPFVILEQEREPGGLARSVQCGRFSFDLCGHVLHVRDTALRAWIEQRLPDRLATHDRRAAIHLFGRLIDYPFQMNLGQLPSAVTAECLEGYLEALGRKRANGPAPQSLRAWAESSFGRGITRHFLAPYNEKLHHASLDDLLADEVQWSVPVPSPRQVVRGALGLPNAAVGYNARFEYPRAGGIGCLPAALAAGIARNGVGRIECATRVAAIDVEARRLATADGRSFAFDALVSTLPLPSLLTLLRGVPDAIRDLANSLRAVAVSCVNLGFARRAMSDRHWIYCPEAELPFFRVGCYSAFSPVDGSSFYVEFSRPAGTAMPTGLEQAALGGLRRLGLARPDEEPEVVQVADLPCAYVIHDDARLRALPVLRDFLERSGIRCAGRYGGWGYGSMADALADGRALASSLDAP